MKICVNCNYELEDKFLFCPMCGVAQTKNTGDNFSDNVNAPVWAKSVQTADVSQQSATTPEASQEASDFAPGNPLNEQSMPIISAPKYSDMLRKQRQTDFFNTVAMVEQPQNEPVDHADASVQDVLYPELPFQGDDEFSGFEIMKIAKMSPKTKRTIKITSIFSASLILIIVGLIVLNNFFPIFPKYIKVPVLYLKNDRVLLTSNNGTPPTDINFSDNATLLNRAYSDIKKVRFTDDYSKMLVLEDYSSMADTYTLYIRDPFSTNWQNNSDKGTTVDSAVLGDYKLVKGGTAIVYRKQISATVMELYLYDFGGTSTKLADNIDSLYKINDNKILYTSSTNELFSIEFGKDNMTPVSISTQVNTVYTPEQSGITDCENFFYLKRQSIYNRNALGELYFVSGETTTKLGDNIESIAAVYYKTGKAYYVAEKTTYVKIKDLIDDDLLESDQNYTFNPKDLSQKYSNSNYEVDQRNNFRQSVTMNQEISISSKSLYFSDGIKQDLVCENFQILTASLPDNKSGNHAVVYKRAKTMNRKVKMSELNINERYNDYFLSQFQTLLDRSLQPAGTYAAVESKEFAVADTALTSVYFNKTGNALYYLDIPSSQIPANGSLKLLKIESGSLSKTAETIDNDVSGFTLYSDAVLSSSKDNGLFIDGVKIASNAKDPSFSEDGKTLVFISGYSAEKGGTLTMLQAGKTSSISENVRSFVLYPNNTLAFIKDYDTVNRCGDLYISSGLSIPKKVDTGVSSPIGY